MEPHFIIYLHMKDMLKSGKEYCLHLAGLREYSFDRSSNKREIKNKEFTLQPGQDVKQSKL